MRIRLRLVQQRTACLLRLNSIQANSTALSRIPIASRWLSLNILEILHRADPCSGEIHCIPCLFPMMIYPTFCYTSQASASFPPLPSTLEIDGIERFDSDKHFLSLYCRLVLLLITPTTLCIIVPAKTAISILKSLSPMLLSTLFSIILIQTLLSEISSALQ